MNILDSFLGRLDIILLIFCRWLGLFTTAPVFSNQFVRVPVRVALALAGALAVYPLFQTAVVSTALPELIYGVLRELIVGMVLGFAASLTFTAIQMAGEWLDIEMGFSMVNVLDPMSHQQLPIVGNFMYLLTLLVFLSIDGHHGLLLAVMDSYVAVPLGGLAAGGELSRQMLALGAAVFRVGFILAAPVFAALFLTTVAVAVVNRAMPQMNVFMIGMPVKAGVGIALLAVLLPLYASALIGLFSRLFNQLYEMMPLLSG